MYSESLKTIFVGFKNQNITQIILRTKNNKGYLNSTKNVAADKPGNHFQKFFMEKCHNVSSINYFHFNQMI